MAHTEPWHTVGQDEPVDVHVHLTPPLMLKSRGREESWRPTVIRDEKGRQLRVEVGGRTMNSIVSELSRIEVVLELSARRGVGALIVSPWVSTIPSGTDRGRAIAICRAQNEVLLSACRQQPGRVAAFGAVPLQDPEAAAEMLVEVVGSGLLGVEVTPCVEGRWLGEPAFEPFWGAAEELGAVVFVHPGTHGLGLDVFGEYYLWNAVANPVETAAAAAQLVMAGVLERHEGLKVVLAHGGGVLPAVMGRLERAFAVRPEARQRLSQGPAASFRRLRFDTVTHDVALLALLVGKVGADHVLLGSDHPFDMGTDDPVGEVRALGLSPADEHLILRGNAVSLCPKLPHGVPS